MAWNASWTRRGSINLVLRLVEVPVVARPSFIAASCAGGREGLSFKIEGQAGRG